MAPEGPVVHDELRQEIGRRHDHAEVLIRLREVGPVPEEEGVPVDGRVALERHLGADLEVGARFGIGLREGQDGGEAGKKDEDEAGDPEELTAPA